MKFMDFRKLVEGFDDRNAPNGSVAFVYSKPIPCEDGSGMYEMAIDDMLVITKPGIFLNYSSDMYQVHDFVKLELKFFSTYDQDLREVFEFLKKFEAEATEFASDETKCPAMSVLIFPKKEELKKETNYMELQLPLMLHLTSKKPNMAPDTICMLFTEEGCSMHEEELIDTAEVDREIALEKYEEERRAKAKEEEEKEKLRRQQLNEELQKQLLNLDVSETITRVGREKEKGNEEEKQTE